METIYIHCERTGLQRKLEGDRLVEEYLTTTKACSTKDNSESSREKLKGRLQRRLSTSLPLSGFRHDQSRLAVNRRLAACN